MIDLNNSIISCVLRLISYILLSYLCGKQGSDDSEGSEGSEGSEVFSQRLLSIVPLPLSIPL